MSKTVDHSVVDNNSVSTKANAARAREKIRMQAQRYQRGSLQILKRKSQSDVWAFRYYAEHDGCRVYKRKIIGTVVELPKRRDAEKAVTQFRVELNEGARCAPMNFEQLAAHYKKEELNRTTKAYSTIVSYTAFLQGHIVPKWGSSSLSAIKAVEVEKWLSDMKRRDGKPVAPATRAKIRNVMSALYAHAIRHGFAVTNPISAVRTSSKRLRDPDFLSPEELRTLLARLQQRERVMVLLDASTGLRRGELMALRWQDLDLDAGVADVTRSIYRNVVGNTKTVASRKPVALHAVVIEELKMWRIESIYRADSDYLFPSIQKNGAQPVSPDMILKRHIRPILQEMGVTKRIGWHSFRHGLGTMLRQLSVDVKVAQEMLRHANPRITMEFYQQAVTDEKRQAQNLVMERLMGTSQKKAPSSTQIEKRKKRSPSLSV